MNLVDYFPAWWESAACRSENQEVFFGSDMSTGRLNAARVHCSACPVAGDCLTHALSVPERFGIWAGTSANSRDRMLADIESGVRIEDVVQYVLTHRFRWNREAVLV